MSEHCILLVISSGHIMSASLQPSLLHLAFESSIGDGQNCREHITFYRICLYYSHEHDQSKDRIQHILLAEPQ